VATRDENLDALQQAVDEFFEEEKKRLDNETKFLRSVAQGRGAPNVGTSNLLSGAKLVQIEIQDFLRNA
jgi:hypothetical protein